LSDDNGNGNRENSTPQDAIERYWKIVLDAFKHHAEEEENE
jgi:hypothetical protein